MSSLWYGLDGSRQTLARSALAASVSGLLTACLMQERRYDASRGMSLLVEDWVSRASALQRKGRAGAPVI